MTDQIEVAATATVEMLSTITGLREGKPWPAKGETVELPTGEAMVLVRQGMAKIPEEGTDAAEVPESNDAGTAGAPGGTVDPESREGLEGRAAEVGLTFPSNMGDDKLKAKVEEAEAAAAKTAD